MKYDCEIIRDLLPLYIDDVASESSRLMVEEHLDECPDCRNQLSLMKHDEAEQAIAAEREEVISGQRKFFKRRSAMAGSVLAGLLMVPLVVSLIVNLASGSGLDWFFVVFAALLVGASVTIVPLMVPENKGVWTLASFATSLILLFGVCCIYGGGSWFFIASTAVLFGLSLVFLPFAIKSKIFSQIPSGYRGIYVMATDTVLYALMMLAIGLRVKSLTFFVLTVSISVPIIIVLWVVFFLVRRSHMAKTKEEFLDKLKDKMAGLPAVKIKEKVDQYSENIDKKMEEGFSEAEAVNRVDSVEEIASRAQSEITGLGLNRGREEKRRFKIWEIALLVIGAPVWAPLLFSGFMVLLSIYIAIWSVIVALWAVFASFAVAALASIPAAVIAFSGGTGVRGVMFICAGLVFAGLSILMFFGCKAATVGVARLTKNIALWVKGQISNIRRK